MVPTSPSGPDGPVHVGSNRTGSSTAGDAVSVPTASATEVATAQPSASDASVPGLTGNISARLAAEPPTFKEPERTGTGFYWATVAIFHRATEGGEQSKSALSIFRTVAIVIVILGLGFCVAAVEVAHWIHLSGGGGMIATITGTTGVGALGVNSVVKRAQRRSSRTQPTPTPVTPQPCTATDGLPLPTVPHVIAEMPAAPQPAVEIPPPRVASDQPAHTTTSDPTA